MKDKTVNMLIRNVPEAVHKGFKLAAIQKGQSMNSALIELMKKFINGESKDAK